MKLLNEAMSGTLESSDAQVYIAPGGTGIELTLESSVLRQYGKQIRRVILDTLARLDVRDAVVHVVDQGAIDCTIKARVETAVFRAAGITEGLPWRELL